MMKEVVKKEVLKWLNVGFIYAILDNPWVSPIHVVPKKGGFTVIGNEKNELIPTRTVIGGRVYIDYRKLNTATMVKDNDHVSIHDCRLIPSVVVYRPHSLNGDGSNLPLTCTKR